MVAFLIQSTLLLLGVGLLGALIGCLLKGFFWPLREAEAAVAAPRAASPVVKLPEAAVPRVAAADAPVVARPIPAARVEPAKVEPAKPVVVAAPAIERVPASVMPPPMSAVSPEVSAAAKAAAEAKTLGAGKATSMVADAGVAAAAVAAAAAAAAGAAARGREAAYIADDLKRIKGIGPEIESRLNRLGVTRYAQIASWSADDVARFNNEFGFDRRIQRENWIEQTTVLARNGNTAFSRQVDAQDEIDSILAVEEQPPARRAGITLDPTKVSAKQSTETIPISEPGIDEILASIRKVISLDSSASQKLLSTTADAPIVAAAAVPDSLPEGQGFPVSPEPSFLRSDAIASVWGGSAVDTTPGLTSSAVDNVDCSVFAPTMTDPETRFRIQVILHVPEAAQAVVAIAKEVDRETARQEIVPLDVPIRRGAQVTVSLDAPALTSDETSSSFIWTGRSRGVSFFCFSGDPFAREAIATVRLFVDSIPAGFAKLLVRFTLAAQTGPSFNFVSPTPIVPSSQRRMHRYARIFLSYSSKDRERVVGAAHLARAVGISYFFDRHTLDPGDDWKDKIEKNIAISDAFMLYWSNHAVQSAAVSDEIELALKQQKSHSDNLPEIIPYLLDETAMAELPSSLSHLHVQKWSPVINP